MTTIKNNDFVEIEYTGRTKEDNIVFDTTDHKVAHDNDLQHDEHADYKPIVVCVGEGAILKSLEDQMIGKEIGKKYDIEIRSSDAFGKKDAKLIQLIPMNKFRQQNIMPVPGLHLNIDGVLGVVKTVSGGRCLVDFNHPLAGKDLVYSVKINRVVDDEKEKLESLMKLHMGIKDAQIEIAQGSANVSFKHEIPKEAQDEFKKIVEKTIPGLKGINFSVAEEKKK